MELQAFEVQVCEKAETRGLEMAFLVKVPQAVVSVTSQLLQDGPSGIQTGFREPNCQAYGRFEETDSVSRRFCFEPLFLDLCNVKETLRMITRNNLL